MLGIIGAMDEEVARLKEQLDEAAVETVAGMDFYRGNFKGRPVVIVRSGIGKVNGAVCAQILCGRFGVSAIVNTGIAGSLKASIDIGDVVLSTDAVHHDMDAANFGYELGQVPRMDTLAFQADQGLLKLAKECCQRVNPDIRVHLGRVVSGDQFISDQRRKDWIADTFHGYCTEMEGAAIAQTAYLNKVPFLIIRAISDKADNSASVDYPAFEAQAIAHSVNLVAEMISRYQEEPAGEGR